MAGDMTIAPVAERVDELGLVQREGNAAMALAMLSESDFEARIKSLQLAQDRVRRIQRELMKPDEDFGVIPGTKKPTLLKPGAEKLCQVYRLVPTFATDMIEGDGENQPDLRVRATCYLHMGSKEGPVVGEGVGAANSWERKHRYRSAQRACPSCGVEGSIRRSKFPDRNTGDKGWYCHDKGGGCGAQFRSDDPNILDQQGGQVDNPDPYDVENTLLKMAVKRAQIDAVLRTTATSGLFAQDLEDLGARTETGEGRERQASPQPGRRQSQSRPEPPRSEPARSEPPRAEAPAMETATLPDYIGKITAIDDKPTGWIISLSTGYRCATTKQDYVAAARIHQQAGTVVELTCRAPKTPGNAPVLVEIERYQAGA